MLAFETKNLTKSYNDKVVVNNINLQVQQGEVFGFLGRNGAGKSTFINMVTGITTPTSGSYNFFESGKLTERNLYKRIGVLPDYSTFYDDLSPVQHLTFFSKMLGTKKSKQELKTLLERVGLGDAMNVKAKKFSFGMKKKLGLAQALVNDPDMIFLDEPTSGVDANSVLDMHAIIHELSAQGKTIFLTSHNLNEIEKLCDRIAIMSNGEIDKQGTLDELRQSFQTQLQVTIKHSPIRDQEMKNIKQSFAKVSDKMKFGLGQKLTSVMVNEEAAIPFLNRALLENNVDVFRIEVQEPSLEEIFLEVQQVAE